MKKNSKKTYTKKAKELKRIRMLLLILIAPALILLMISIYTNERQNQESNNQLVPEEFIPIYKAAESEFGVPWYLLAAHHRVETIFSTMDPMLSPAGAEGHMQFMPCTFVGWAHPTCGGLGVGEIPDEEKIDPRIIAKYNGFGIDANGDGVADPWDIEDAIFSAANFLAFYGANEGKLKEAIFEYNHSDQYVEDVMYYAELYKNALDDK